MPHSQNPCNPHENDNDTNEKIDNYNMYFLTVLYNLNNKIIMTQNIHIEQWNEIEDPEENSHSCMHLILRYQHMLENGSIFFKW